ncbi:MAG: response regulator [Alphaproteobacteria bacterium]|nr:response regulator [Alphaproteobacteria bacterium]
MNKNIPETQLLERLRHFWIHERNKRCLILRVSKHERSAEDWNQLLRSMLEGEYRDDCDEMITGHDGDIYIFSRTMTSRLLQKFLAHLAHKLPPALDTPGSAELFEVGVDWPHLRDLCERKIALAQSKTALQKPAPNIDMLPAAQALNEIADPLVRSISERRAKRTNPQIMIVEDDKFSQRLVSNALGEKFPLSVTEDGEGAILSYVNKTPDVLFLDIGLPDIDGLMVLEKIFSMDPHAYVVMFSGNGNKENIKRAIALGAKGFVAKPFTREKLLQYIERSPFIQAKRGEFMGNEGNNHGTTLH